MSKLARRIVPAAVAVWRAACRHGHGHRRAGRPPHRPCHERPHGLQLQGVRRDTGHDGWILSPSSGPAGFSSGHTDRRRGVGWAPDGSEMVHDASVTKALYGHDSQTVFLSESNYGDAAGLHADFDYPWQDTNYRNVADPRSTRRPRSRRTARKCCSPAPSGAAKIEQIPAAGWDPPIDLAQRRAATASPRSGAATSRSSTSPARADLRDALGVDPAQRFDHAGGAPAGLAAQFSRTAR